MRGVEVFHKGVLPQTPWSLLRQPEATIEAYFSACWLHRRLMAFYAKAIEGMTFER